MSLCDVLLPEFDQEMATTRRALERVPDDKFSYKPHEKSMTMGRLAIHLGEIPAWTSETLYKDELDMAPVGGPAYVPPSFATTKELLAFFDKNVAVGREALAKTSDDIAKGTWSLLAGGQTLFTMPKMDVIRTWVLNHSVHHRGQLSVYLRLNEVPVPSIYGPSADEGM